MIFNPFSRSDSHKKLSKKSFPEPGSSKTFPDSGTLIIDPDGGTDKSVRYLIEHHWKVVYKVDDGTVFVLAVIDTRSDSERAFG